MAEQDDKIVFSVQVNGAEKEIKTLKDLKQARKDLTDAIISGDDKAAASLAKLNDKLEDVKDAAIAVKGTGIESATSSFRLLGDSVKELDFGKFKTALGGLKTALASTGILLLVQGVTYLIENFDSLSKGSGLLAKALRFVGDIIGGIKDGLLFLTDAIGLTNTAIDKLGEDIVKNAAIAQDALAKQNAEYDRQITVAKAAGKSTIEIEKLKQQAIIDTNLALAQQIEAQVRAGGEFTDDLKKQLTASLDAIKNAKVQEYVVSQADYKTKQDAYKKHLDELKKINEQSQKDVDAAVQSAEDDRIKREVQQNADLQKRSDDRKSQAEKDAEDQIKLEDEASANFDKLNQTQIDKSKNTHEQIAANRQVIEQDSFNAAKGLSDAFFSIQINNAKGNAKQIEALQKKKFEVDKAFQVAQATMDGIRSVTGALAQTATLGPGAVILAIANGVLAAANVAKILAVQYNGSGGGSGSDVSAPPSVNAAPPPPPQFIQQGGNPATGNNLQNSQPIRAYVVETDVTSSQDHVGKIKNQAGF